MISTKSCSKSKLSNQIIEPNYSILIKFQYIWRPFIIILWKIKEILVRNLFLSKCEYLSESQIVDVD